MLRKSTDLTLPYLHTLYQPEYSITATLPKFNCARKFAFLSNSIPLLLG